MKEWLLLIEHDNATLLGTSAAAGVTVGLVFVALAIGGFWMWKKRQKTAFDQEKLNDVEMAGPKLSLPETRPDFSRQVSQVEAQNIELGAVLGKGAFGKVHQALHQGADVAVKLISEVTPESEAEFQKEIQLNELLPKHDHVVQMLAVVTGEITGIVMTLFPLCSLQDHLDRIQNGEIKELTFPETIQLLIDISAGLICMHDSRVVHRSFFHSLCWDRLFFFFFNPLLTQTFGLHWHRDIACRNVLIRQGDAGLRAAVCDFGLSLKLADGETEGSSSAFPKERIPINMSAPEAFMKGKYSEKTDTYMFGMLCYELFARAVPFTEFLQGFDFNAFKLKVTIYWLDSLNSPISINTTTQRLGKTIFGLSSPKIGLLP